MTNRKKIQVTISGETYEKLLDMSERYGITYNSVAAFGLGQWADQSYASTEALSTAVDSILSSPEDVLTNPDLLNIVQAILVSDKDFKNDIRDFMERR